MLAPRRSLAVLSIATVCALLSACKSKDDGAAGPMGPTPDGAAPAGGSPSAVTGTSVDLYVAAQGEVRIPAPPEENKRAALIVKADGTVTTLRGTAGADGSFSILDVPQGTYFLRLDDGEDSGFFLLTSRRMFTFGGRYLGRPDAAKATGPTPLHIDLDGLEPWKKEASDLHLYSINARSSVALQVSYPVAPDTMLGVIQEGATSLRNVTVELYDFEEKLIDASKGDEALVLQSEQRMAGELRYWTPVRSLTRADFTQADGQPATLSGTLQPVPSGTATFDWKQTAFAALARQVNPTAKPSYRRLDLEAEAMIGGRYHWTDLPGLVSLEGEVEPGTLEDEVLTTQYGNPYPADWPLDATISIAFSIDHGGGTTSGASVAVGGKLDELTRSPIVPLVGPPQELRINGVTAAGAVSGAGLTPTITWKPPALGKTIGYTVTIEQDYRSVPGIDSFLAQVAYFDIEDVNTTTLKVPPGVLRDGRYVVHVTAFGDHPGSFYSWAETVSGMVTP
jgi:hypothetical protein